MDKKLASEYIEVDEVSDSLKENMYLLFALHYDGVNRKVFEDDLSSKSGVIVLLDRVGELQGFSTILWDAVPMPDCEVVFSGDTIIHPNYWGSRELITKFCWLCGQRLSRGTMPLYWFLISKGHRTYQFLPLFSKQWFPSPDSVNDVEEKLASKCAEEMFGNAWIPEEGVLRFKSCMGNLNPDLAATTELRKGNRYVQFFLENNPNFALGEELVCMVKMELDNLRGTALSAFKEGVNA